MFGSLSQLCSVVLINLFYWETWIPATVPAPVQFDVDTKLHQARQERWTEEDRPWGGPCKFAPDSAMASLSPVQA